ncbi:MAG: DUF4922 domain-containing protein [Paludibacteraceae bacterium]
MKLKDHNPLSDTDQLLSDQLSVWETARNNYEALKHVKMKELNINGVPFKVQFNPARIVSSGAKVDAKSIQERKCFLCAENRPKEQEGLPFGEHYTILINPFPIFPKHFTIPANEHVPQQILSRYEDMLALAEYMSDCLIFYNGPKCGASAPDHVHFQAGNKGFLPIEKEWKNHLDETISETENISLFSINYGFPAFVIQTNDKHSGTKMFEKIYNNLEIKDEETEPMMNILAWMENKKLVTIIIPRSKHRPDCYFAEGEKNRLISPASVDLGGVFITPKEKDFDKITEKDIAEILSEVCLDTNQFYKIKNKLRS